MSLRRRVRSQAGYTLLELLVAVSITAIVLVPVMSWAILVMRQQPVERDGMLRTSQSGLLGSMFPSDVSVAGQASASTESVVHDTHTEWLSGMQEPWATDCAGGASANGSVHLVMISAGSTIQRVVYSVARSSENAAEVSVWRRTCGVGSDDTLMRENELFRGVRPGQTSVSCSSRAGDSACREIELTVTPLKGNQPIEMTATRRVDNNSASLDALGNPMPVALITLESRTSLQPMTAVFSATRSTVGPGRTVASYAWEFEPDVVVSDTSADRVTANFPALGAGQPVRNFTIRLTVTDDLGHSNTAFSRIASSNADPVAVISRISPNPVTIGNTVTLSAVPSGGMPGSYDPDGSIIRFDWLITFAQTDVSIPPRQVNLSGPVVSYATKAGDAGDASVRLTVTDLQLAQATVSAPLSIIDPAVPTTTTTPNGPIVALFTDSAGASMLVRNFDASTSTGVGPGATFAWSYGDGSTGSGVTSTHTYAASGTYNVVLTVTSADGRSATTTRAVAVGGPLPAPSGVRHNGTYVLWDPVAGARRYLVDFEFRTPTDCYRTISNQAVGAISSPSKQIPSNPCPANATAMARVGADSGESVSWSGWISVPTINGTPPTTVPTTTTQPPVVK